MDLDIPTTGAPSTKISSLSPAVQEGLTHALGVLRRNIAPQGLVASNALPQYATIWTRDLAYSAMGANVSGDHTLVEAVGRSLRALAKVQSPSGQIANDYWPGREYWDFHESGSTDATALFIVAAAQHLAAHPDPALQRQLLPALRKAHHWLSDQDANQFTLIDSPSGGDWMDSTFQRGGKLLYTNALWYRALNGMAQLDHVHAHAYRQHAALLKRKMNYYLWPENDAPYAEMLDGIEYPKNATVEYPHPVGPAARRAAIRPDRTHYISHVDGQRFVDECDVLGNVLAVLFEVADSNRARTIMQSLHDSVAAQPYPMRTYPRSFSPDDNPAGMLKPDLEGFQGPRWRNPPGSYHNGGVWPFIGGLYVAALQKVGMVAEAKAELERLTAADRLGENGHEWGFHEWIHADTGKPDGAADQAWSAGTFVLAAHAVAGDRVAF